VLAGAFAAGSGEIGKWDIVDMVTRGRARRAPTVVQQTYMEAIAAGMAEHGHAHVTMLADSLGVSKPSVVQVVHRLEEEGLVVRAGKELSLTAGGRRLWRELEARHRVIQSFMVDVLGMDDAAAYEEACRLEHYATQSFVDRLAAHQRDLMGRSL
jgi:Mn-dependent DtxR family transcriptional regulator